MYVRPVKGSSTRHTGQKGNRLIEVIMSVLLTLMPVGKPVHGVATYFHPTLVGNLMRDETPYDDTDPFIAAVGVDNREQPSIPLGTWLLVCTRELEKKCMIAQVRDTGRFVMGDLDLSESGFALLFPLSRGRIPIEWQRLGIP